MNCALAARVTVVPFCTDAIVVVRIPFWLPAPEISINFPESCCVKEDEAETNVVDPVVACPSLCAIASPFAPKAVMLVYARIGRRRRW